MLTIPRGAGLLLALPITLLLAACSGEPGPAEMKQAFRNNPIFMQSLHGVANLGASMGGGPAQNVEQVFDEMTFEKGSCATASGVPGHICDFRVGRNMGGQMNFSPWNKARFFQASGSWQFEQQR